jgi:hypothetical protein
MGEINVLSFGAGVQTVALVCLITKGKLPKPDYIIFSDPQWESSATYEYLKWFRIWMECHNLELITVTKGNIREDALGSKRFASLPVYTMNEKKGRLRRQCTNEYKIQVVHKTVRQLLGVPKYGRLKNQVNMWLGISTDEASRMKPSRLSKTKNVWPLIDLDLSREDCEKVILSCGLPIPPKSACIGCPFHNDRYWADMKKRYPDEFKNACDFDDQIRDMERRGLTGKLYLHRSCIPLKDVVFGSAEEDFTEECEGLCGL